jgi:hypothetical protein
MSRKHRPPLSRPTPAATPVSPETHARQVLEAGHYREAVELYKNLLKQERRSEWLDGLAAGYAGRARELANKGMLQEALVVWRNRSSLCGKLLAEGPYLDWLLRTGAHDAALRLLTPIGDAAATVDADLETRLAAVALTAPDSALAQLAAESPLRRHRAAAQAAIAACCRADLADLDEQLRGIPFRSPYRDLRFILKALLLVGNDAAQATGLIARVTVDGPFERLAAVVRAGVLPGRRWLLALLDLDEESRHLLLEIKGYPENRRPLLLEVAELARTGVAPTPTRVVDLLLHRNRGLPVTAARLCRRLLPYAEKRLAEYQNAFGPLGEAETACILALAAEVRRAIESSESHWLRAARLFSTVEEAPLQAALILRHLFDLIVGHEDAADYDDECTTWLKRSLELDPDDRATHLKLIRLHRQGQDLKAARASVETALARFANDPAVLLEAVETALAGNAFKKAVTLAKRLLDLDPINSKVRALIGQAHLSHARKQIRLHRPEAAGKELDLADEWLATANERSVSKLLRGLSATDAPATVRLREAVDELGGKLLAAWHVLLESIRVGSQPAGELRRAAPNLSGMPVPREVLNVMHAINALGKNESKALRTVLDTLRAPLKRGAAGDFSESERISICETLLLREEQGLLQAYANAGLQRWPERPVFVYLATFAKHGKGAFFAMSERERQTLEAALKKALEDGDQRTVLRIRDLMGPPGFFSGEDSDDFDDDDFGDSVDDLPANPRDVFELLMSMGGHNEVIRMAREVLPDSKFRPLERAAGGNRKKLAEMLIELLVESLANLDLSSFLAPPSGGSPVPKPKPHPPAPKQAVQDDRQKGLFDD